MFFEEPEEEHYDPLFLPLSELRSKRRDRQFLRIVGKVLRLSWLKHKTLEERQSTIQRLMPSFARRCIDNNDFLSLQEILNHMDIDAADYDGNTVLHRACEKGNNDMVLQLLALGASCQMTNRFGFTPLHLAIKNKHNDVIKILMPQGATVTLHPVRIGMELIKAVRAKDYRLVHAWYLAGTNMNERDYNGQTALHAAVEKRDKLMVSKLLQYGATPEIADVWERTAADEAREKNLHDILKLFNLIEN
ncbi:L-asparaginase [Megalobrama amblycephala]|uniref:L-asparaginase n=1 Tax=Megalobrama amblycephala TaxID=75352 RepID=UPI002013D417|nr:L-asparaginase [Megalobrama amblycephala]